MINVQFLTLIIVLVVMLKTLAALLFLNWIDAGPRRAETCGRVKNA